MSADDQTSGERWLDMTNAAYDKVTGFLLQLAEPERQAMWIEVTGTSTNQWTCNISLKPLDAAAPHDAIVRHRDLAIVVPERDFDKVRGATIDWLDDPFGTSGLRVENPNTPSPAIGAPPPADLSGDVAQRVIQVLDQQVNPTIAAHGAAWEAPPRSRARRSWPATANGQVNSLPSTDSRARVQPPQNGRVTEAITPISPPPSP